MRKLPPILTSALLLSALPAPAGELLFADNFDAPDTDNLDLSDQAGRRSGLNTQIQVRSSRIQHGIVSNQLNFLNNRTGRIRFHDDLDNDNTTGEGWHDWAAGPEAATILAEGGFRVEFDWIAGNDTSGNWVSVNVGLSDQAAGEPGFRVNHAQTDIGLLFRYNGLTELFDNGTNLGAQGSFAPTIGLRHVTLDYRFDSFADNTAVSMVASVDGTEVFNGDGFTWDNNGGVFIMELGTLEDTVIDNLSISGVAAAGYSVFLDGRTFFSSLAMGEAVGTLSAADAGVPEPSTFAFVDGDGDDDNTLFQIVGDELQIGGFDFLNEPDGTEYSVRILATGDGGEPTAEQAFTLRVTADADADTLPDTWENATAGNLTDLNGLGAGPGPGAGSGDFDGDTLTDFEEWELDLGSVPGIDPTLADTDGDDLDDAAEIAGAGDRPPTSPTDADSDDDSLTDGQESNSGTYVDADDTGSDPTDADSDDDGYRDGFDALRGGDPTDPALVPVITASASLVMLTDDASTGIDVASTYTHAISGGGAATINGVTLEEFSPAVMPANVVWDTGAANMSQIPLTGGNIGDWDPVAGGVTGTGLLDLLGGFTYSGTGANAGSMQTFTLTGLTPGQGYLLRLFVRVWDTEGSGRPADLSFTNGAVVDYAPILEDRTNIVLGGGASPHTAYAIAYEYVAAGSELIISTAVPAGAQVPSGSFHFFGLTNELGGPPTPARITAISYDPSTPSVTITFDGQAGKDYALDVSTALNGGGSPGGWTEVNDSVPSTGEGSVVVDDIVAGTVDDLFYRLRDTEAQPEP